MAEILLCLTGEVMIKYIQTNAAVQVFNKSLDFCKNIFLKSYGIDLDMNNVNSVLYNILKEKGSTTLIVRQNVILTLHGHSATHGKLLACRTIISKIFNIINPLKGEHSQSPCLLELKENIFHQLSSAGVVPLKLPNPVPLDGPNVEMSVLLLEYDMLKALSLCSNIILKGFKGEWANENEEKAISTFLNAMTSFFVNEDILIPSSSSPRLVRLENELVERVVSQFSHILSHQNIIR